MNAGDAWDVYGNRAIGAYLRGEGMNQPCRSSSGAEVIDGQAYIVLRNVNGVLAVYRIRNNGSLRRLDRWPPEVMRW
jgi:hypothetical protein